MAGYGHFLHCLYHEVYLTREAINSPVARVSAHTAQLRGPQPQLVEDTFICTMEFANGALAIFHDVMVFPDGGGGISVFETHGTRGSILRNIPLTSPHGELFRDGVRTPVPPLVNTSANGMVGVFDAFVHSIETDTPLPYQQKNKIFLMSTKGINMHSYWSMCRHTRYVMLGERNHLDFSMGVFSNTNTPRATLAGCLCLRSGCRTRIRT